MKAICFICQEEVECELVGDFPEISHCLAHSFYHWCAPCRADYISYTQVGQQNIVEDDFDGIDNLDDLDWYDPDWEPALVLHQSEEDWDWWLIVNDNLPYPV